MTTLKKYKNRFKDIIIPEVNKEINPGDNFYNYVNGIWLKKTRIPEDEASFSVNEEIENIIDSDLFFIINQCSKFAEKGMKVSSFTNILNDCIGRFALSSNRISVQKNSVVFLKKTLQNIQCLRSIDDIGEILGFFCRNKIESILSSYLHLERTKGNKTIYTLFLLVGGLGLPDITYYNATAPGKIRTLYAYIELIKKVCKILSIDDLSNSVTLESFFAVHMDNANKDEGFLIKGYELEELFRSFPWVSFFESVGIPDWRKHIFRIQSKKYFHVLEKAFQTIPLDQWKELFKLHIIIHALPILPPPFDDLDFEFYGKRLHGQKKKVSQKDLTLDLIKKYISTPLSILYKEYFLKKSLKQKATLFIKNIQESALKQIKTNDWLEPHTKEIALKKIKNMVLSIAWPDETMPMILPNLQTDNLLQNIYLLSSASTADELKFLNKESIPGKMWSEPSFIVNAFYYNEINEFIVPAGSLFYPFFVSEEHCSKGWNYGGLGCVIGHEMVHAFDDNGKEYDEYGLYNPWWKLRDNRRFHKYSKYLIDLFNKSKINGTLTLNENLADLGGMSIALEALKFDIKNYSLKQKKYELQQFFISYAVSWRTKNQKEKVLQDLFMDRHSPPELRVNNIVSQFNEWYEIFDIQVSDKLYIAPEDRIRVY
jgi:putative endopeptidase